eukprot:2440471-Prymnesium_polylepis.2
MSAGAASDVFHLTRSRAKSVGKTLCMMIALDAAVGSAIWSWNLWPLAGSVECSERRAEEDAAGGDEARPAGRRTQSLSRWAARRDSPWEDPAAFREVDQRGAHAEGQRGAPHVVRDARVLVVPHHPSPRCARAGSAASTGPARVVASPRDIHKMLKVGAARQQPRERCRQASEAAGTLRKRPFGPLAPVGRVVHLLEGVISPTPTASACEEPIVGQPSAPPDVREKLIGCRRLPRRAQRRTQVRGVDHRVVVSLAEVRGVGSKRRAQPPSSAFLGGLANVR